MLIHEIVSQVDTLAARSRDAHRAVRVVNPDQTAIVGHSGGGVDPLAEEVAGSAGESGGSAEESSAWGSADVNADGEPHFPIGAGLTAVPILYVSSDLRFWGASEAQGAVLARDLSQIDADDVARVYRRPDASWYAWLVHRTAQAKRAVREGLVDEEQARGIEVVHTLLRIVRAWAMAHLDADEVAAAIKRGIPRGYEQPRVSVAYVRVRRKRNMKK